MTEPSKAYVATTVAPDEVQRNDGIGSSGRGYTTSTDMYLNPTQAIYDAFKELGKFFGDDTKMHIYQIDLSELDGVWPRVNYQQYNGFELQWQSRYDGKIPASAIKWINSITKELFLLTNRV